MRMHTWRTVVADGEVRRDVAPRVDEASGGAVVRSAADPRRVDPHDLREVAPAVEAGQVWSRLAVVVVEVGLLVVVEEVGDNEGDVVGGHTGRDVLAVAAATGGAGGVSVRCLNIIGGKGIGLRVMRVDAGGGDAGGGGSESGIPDNVRSRMVRTMDVVVAEDLVDVGGRGGG